MANGVNVKMGVSGVSQFKQGIKQAQTSVKTLDQALKLNEKQFKATGDAESYMQQKSELLKQKLEEQRGIVAQAERALEQMAKNGVEKNSRAYQEMQQQLLKAKGDLLDTEGAINGVAEAGEAAGDGVDAMNQQLQRIGENMSTQNVLDGLDKITGGIESVIKKAWQMGEALVTNTLGAGAWADNIATLATQWGVDADTVQRMLKTEALIDTDAEDIITSRDKMMTLLRKGSTETMGAWAALGLDPAQFNTVEDKYWAAGEAIAAMTDAEDQQAYSMAIFGKGWRELMPLFTAGRTEYEKTMASWSTVSDENLDKLTAMDDQYQKLTGEWETFKMTMLSTLADTLTPLMEVLTGLLEKFNTYLASPEGKEMLESMSQAVAGIFEDISNIDPKQVIQSFSEVFKGIIDGCKWIYEHRQDVIHAMEAIVAGWAALKITGGALQLFQLITGLQWLHNNPRITLPGTSPGTTPTTAPVVGAGGSDVGFRDAGGFGALGTIAAMAGLGYLSAKAIGDWKAANPEKVLGTEENRAVRIGGNGDALMEYVLAQGAMEQLDYTASAETVMAAQERIDQAWARLEEAQGGMEALRAYNDWRSINNIGMTDWRMTPEMMAAMADRTNGGEVTSAMDRMVSETTSSQTQQTAATKDSNAILQGLPARIGAEIAAAMGGIKVYIDGQTAGSVLTPYVNAGLGSAVGRMAMAMQ